MQELSIAAGTGADVMVGGNAAPPALRERHSPLNGMRRAAAAHVGKSPDCSRLGLGVYACRRSGELPSGAFWRNRCDVRYDEREFSHATVTVSANSCLFIFNFLSTNFKRLNQSMVTFGSYRLDKV